MKKRFEEILKKINVDKKVLIIISIGLTGIILLAVTELFPEEEKTDVSDNKESNMSFYEYEKNIEERLEVLLESIDGAGNVEVMVTVESNDEKVYATESTKSDSREDKKYVLIDSDGNDNGLLLKISQPEIRGVGVVCQGADLPQVRQEISATVTSVLRISSNRVNISKMKTVSGG